MHISLSRFLYHVYSLNAPLIGDNRPCYANASCPGDMNTNQNLEYHEMPRYKLYNIYIGYILVYYQIYSNVI